MINMIIELHLTYTIAAFPRRHVGQGKERQSLLNTKILHIINTRRNDYCVFAYKMPFLNLDIKK